MVYAYRGVGKTQVSLGAAYAVASGGRLFNWSAPEPRRVLFVDGEMPAATIQERLAMIVAASDQEPPSPDYLKIITPDLQPDGFPDLSTDAGQMAIQEHLDGVELVILDNLSTLCWSGKENEADSWDSMARWILRLRRHGKSVLLIHHAGKGGQQRGTSRREDALDTVIALRRPEDYEPEEGARFEVHFEKARGVVGEAVKPFEAKMETRDNKVVWTMRSLEDVEMMRVADLVEEGYSVRDIATETGLSKSKVGRLKKRAGLDQLASMQVSHVSHA